MNPNIYFAGKVQSSTYRDVLLYNTEGKADTVMSKGDVLYTLGGMNGGFIYVGCFAYSPVIFEHGLVKQRNTEEEDESLIDNIYDNHALYAGTNVKDFETLRCLASDRLWSHEATYGINRSNVCKLSLDQINIADGVIAYIESADAYGTIAEIVYASTNNKPVLLGFDYSKMSHKEIDDMWFMTMMPNVQNCGARTIDDFRSDFVKFVNNQIAKKKEYDVVF